MSDLAREMTYKLELYRTMMNAGLFIWDGPDKDDPSQYVYILEKRPTYEDGRHAINEKECHNTHQIRCSSHKEAVEKAEELLGLDPAESHSFFDLI